MKINKFWQVCVYYILTHISLFCLYADSRVFGLYPLDIFSYKNEKIHITNVEGYPGFFDGDYHVYTDKGEFINRDSTLLGKFNSHDLQNYMFLTHDKRNSVDCNVKVAGFRIYGPGKLSFLPNITKIQCD